MSKSNEEHSSSAESSDDEEGTLQDQIWQENQSLIQATRDRDAEEVELKIAGRDPVTLTESEYEELLTEIRRTKWLLEEPDTLEEDETVMEVGGKFMGKGECHECGYEGYLVENSIGTVLCPKCRSTNVGWPKRV